MPKLFLVQAAQPYKAQPVIQIGYNTIRGGFGTVLAIVMLQPMLIHQAKSSTQKRKRLDCQSLRIQSIVGLKKSICIKEKAHAQWAYR
jgi:hypothetical protein